MFFSVFWTVYIPVVTIILSVVGEWLIRFFRQLRGHAWLAPSNRRRISRSNEIEGVRSGGGTSICIPVIVMLCRAIRCCNCDAYALELPTVLVARRIRHLNSDCSFGERLSACNCEE